MVRMHLSVSVSLTLISAFLFYSAVYLSDFGLARVKEKEVNTTLATVGPVKVLYRSIS